MADTEESPVKIEHLDDRSILTYLVEDMDASNSRLLMKLTETLLTGVDTRLDVDIRQVVNLDSSGIAVLYSINRRLEGRVAMTLKCSSPRILSILQVLNLDSFFYVECQK